MNFSAPTPVEVAIMGPDFAATRTFAASRPAFSSTTPSCRMYSPGTTAQAYRMGSWTVTSFVPSGKVASTWTSWIISAMPSITW